MLIKVDPNANNNKFYRVTLNEDESVSTVFGRVGDPGKPGASKGSGRAGFEKTIAAKEKKGYVKMDHVVLDGATESKSTSNKATLLEHARRDLAGGDGADALTASLVERLVKINAHDIALASGGKIKVHDDGQVRTPLGVLTIPGIEAGEKILDELEKDPKNPSLLASYMSIVPQDVGRGRDWTENFFNARRTILQQRQFLEQLRDSVLLATQATPLSDERAFAYRLRSVAESSTDFEMAVKMFTSTKNETHHRAASQYKISKVYAVSSEKTDAAFETLIKDEPFVSNTRRMWHGTRAVNILSILSIGLQHPSKSVGRKAGAMFGRGLYFSEQSTKSLNYSRGMWQGTHDDTVMMFICDVAMGWEFRPNLHAHILPSTSRLGFGSQVYDDVLVGKYNDDARHEGKQFTSINVKAGTSGVLNHEAIVPGPEQVALRYLVEFNI
jgi:poly [ADP-ribose] polymerase